MGFTLRTVSVHGGVSVSFYFYLFSVFSSHSRDYPPANHKSCSHHLPGYGLLVSMQPQLSIWKIWYCADPGSVLTSSCLLSASCWQTTPLLSSFSSLRAQGEEPLQVTSQELQGQSLFLLFLTQKWKEGGAQRFQPTERALPQTEEPCV